MSTSELDMSESVDPADIDTFIDNAAWAIHSTYHAQCWYGARQCGKQSNAYNLILRLICGTCLHMTSDDDQTRPQHTSQPT